MKHLIDLVLSTGNGLMNTTFTVEDLRSKWRHQDLVSIRHAYFYLMDKHSKKTLMAIGAELNRDHATIIHSRKEVKNAMQNPATGNKKAAFIVVKCERLFKAFIDSEQEEIEEGIVAKMLETSQYLQHFKKRERAKAHLAVELCKRYVEDFELMLKDDTSMEGWRREVMKRKLESVKYQLR